MNINGFTIQREGKPFIIAEISANHNGCINACKELIRLAKLNGANAVKIQTYTPDTITLKSTNNDFMIEEGLWKGKSLYELYGEAYTPWEWHEELFHYSKDLNITLFSSPFDKTAVDLLEKCNAPAYKIASFEIVDHELIRYAAETKKPLIISTGMANLEEITEAYEVAIKYGSGDLALLHCVSGYPAPEADYNLKTISDMLKKFECPIGLSDHTLSNVSAIGSIFLGASIIEKHFTLDRSAGGPDDSFSMEPIDLKNLVNSCSAAWKSKGSVNYERKESELPNVKFRRSLYFVKKGIKGATIDESMIRSVRPGYGLAPKEFRQIIGKKLKRDVEANTPVTGDDLDV